MAVSLPFFILTSCSDDDDNGGSGDSCISTMDVTDITSNSATFRGKISRPEQIGNDFEIGFEVSESKTFEEESTSKYSVASYSGDDMTFMYVAERCLKAENTYYVRAYMFNLKCLYHGNVKSFKTSEASYEYVDLGLSVMWATMNVGASAPEEYGDYFAWGETEPYYEPGYAQSDKPVWKPGKSAGYDWPSYKYCKGTEYTLTKYCTDSNFGYNGFVDNKLTLDLEDDAAHANWGGEWRMPAKEEFEELINEDNCSWEWTTLNGVNGYKVQSKIPGYTDKWIFLPAGSMRRKTSSLDGDSLEHHRGACNYWSSSLYGYENHSEQIEAYTFFGWEGGFRQEISESKFTRGLSVRPVWGPFVQVTGIELNKSELSLTKLRNFKLTATLIPSNAARRNIVWESSDYNVAEVYSNGVIFAIGAGTCTITARCGSASASCSVTVSPPEF